MSTSTGTATDFLDLLAKLRTFLTTDSTLTAAGQNWTELAYSTTSYTVSDNSQTNTVVAESYLKAPGLSTTEAIYIDIQAYKNVGTDIYNWRMRGATGYLSSASWFAQPGASYDSYLFLWNQPITYWFIANGQRVIIFAKVSTVYESAYLGKMLPYAVASQYPYPLVIAGTSGNIDGVSGGSIPQNANLRFSDTSPYHHAFFDPFALQICHPDGSWQIFQNWAGSGYSPSGTTANSIHPWVVSGYSSGTRLNDEESNVDGSYTIKPTRFEQGKPANNVLGEFDGVFFVTGFSNSSEADITVGSADYKVFQDTFRTTSDEYCAVLWS